MDAKGDGYTFEGMMMEAVQTAHKKPVSAPLAPSYDEWVSSVMAAYDFDLVRAYRNVKDYD